MTSGTLSLEQAAVDTLHLRERRRRAEHKLRLAKIDVLDAEAEIARAEAELERARKLAGY